MTARLYFGCILFFKSEPESRDEAVWTIYADRHWSLEQGIGLPEWVFSIAWRIAVWLGVKPW